MIQERKHRRESFFSTTSPQPGGNVFAISIIFLCNRIKRITLMRSLPPFLSHFTHIHTHTHTCIRVYTCAHTLCLLLPACSSSLNKIKVLSCLCEYNIALLYLFIYFLTGPEPFNQKTVQQGALKGFPCALPVKREVTSPHLPSEEPCL